MVAFGRIPHVRVLVALVVALALGVGVYAFTASNTVPNSTAGAGAGVVSGYTISGLHYALNSTTPTNIDSLTFTVTPVIPSAGTGKAAVSASLSTGGPLSYSCTTNAAGDTVTCVTTSPQLTTALITGLTVIAAQ